MPPHVALFADFVEHGAGDNLDTFLTRVSTMPALSQNKLLQEKLLLINEKLVNVFEELTNVSRFHDKLGAFLTILRDRIATAATLKNNEVVQKGEEDEEEEETVTGNREIVLDGDTIQLIERHSLKALNSLSQFSVFFSQLKDSPAVKTTIQSEISRLNDLKNCEYHRMKIKQFMGDYNKCVEENLKLKEHNMKLQLGKRTIQHKLEIASKRLHMFMSLD